MKAKTVVTITSTKSDLVRLSGFCEELDKNFDHIFIHDKIDDQNLTEELQIREPDYRLNYTPDQQAVDLVRLFDDKKIKPNIILLIGDSDFTTASVSLKKQGYVLAHLGAGQRSNNKNTPAEINRIICDHCSDYHLIYNKIHGSNLTREKLPKERVFTVGNAIEKTTKEIHTQITKNKAPKWFNKHIILEINLPENFKNKDRLNNILIYANDVSMQFGVPIYITEHAEVIDYVRKFYLELGVITKIKPESYIEYLRMLSKSVFLISDSMTSQEQATIFGIPTIVPRDQVEDPLPAQYDCSFILDVNYIFSESWKKSLKFIESSKPNSSWLGGAETPQNIVDSLEIILNN